MNFCNSIAVFWDSSENLARTRWIALDATSVLVSSERLCSLWYSTPAWHIFRLNFIIFIDNKQAFMLIAFICLFNFLPFCLLWALCCTKHGAIILKKIRLLLIPGKLRLGRVARHIAFLLWRGWFLWNVLLFLSWNTGRTCDKTNRLFSYWKRCKWFNRFAKLSKCAKCAAN